MKSKNYTSLLTSVSAAVLISVALSGQAYSETGYFWAEEIIEYDEAPFEGVVNNDEDFEVTGGVGLTGEGDLEFTNNGDISGEGGEAYPTLPMLFIESGQGNINVNNSGNVTSQDSYYDGIVIQGYQEINVENSGDINVGSASQYGLIARSGENDEYGYPALGGDINLQNTGNITVDGGYESVGLGGESNGGNVTVTNGDEWAAEATQPTITVSGEDAIGMGGRSLADGDGENEGVAGNVLINNHGNVEVEGDWSHGIIAESHGGDVEIRNTGIVNVDGQLGIGISGTSGEVDAVYDWETDSHDITFIDGGNVTITNEGTINAGLQQNEIYYNDDYAGIFANSFGDGSSIDVLNSGDINVIGEMSSGITANGGAEHHYYDSETETETAVYADGSSVSVNNEGNISVTGEEGNGINAYSSQDLYMLTSDQVADRLDETVAVINGGNIQVNGDDAVGIVGAAIGETYIENNGTIGVTGHVGIVALSRSNATVHNAGDISVNVNHSEEALNSEEDIISAGIAAFSPGNAEILNSGNVSITTQHTRPTIGLLSANVEGESFFLDTGLPMAETASITNSGSVNIEGIDGAGVALGASDTMTFTNTADGEVIASQVETTTSATSSTTSDYVGSMFGVVISSNGGTATINNAGLIQSDADSGAIVAFETIDTEMQLVDSVSSIDNITNSGTIIGGANLGRLNDTLTNSGTLVGDFQFGEGDDVLNLSGGEISQAAFFGGTTDADLGTDSVNFAGGAMIDGTQFDGFEALNLAMGEYSGAGLTSFEGINVGSDAAFILDSNTNNLTSTGVITAAAGDQVTINGDLDVSGDGVLDLEVNSSSDHANVNVTGDATFESDGNLHIHATNAETLVADEGATVLTASDIAVGEIEDGTTFDVSDNIVGFDFTATVQDDAAGGQSLVLSFLSLFTNLVDDVDESLGEEAAEIFEALDSADDEDNGFSDEQQAALEELRLEVSDYLTEHSGEEGSTDELVQGLSSNPGAASGNKSRGSVENSAAGFSQARASGRSRRGGSQVGGQQAENNYTQNARVEKVEHVMSYMDSGYEGSQAVNETTEVWLQTFGGAQNSDVNGISSSGSAWGLSGGVDYQLESDTIVGFGITYSDSFSKNSNAVSTTKTDGDTLGASVYAGHRFDSGTGISAVAGYYLTQSDQTRSALGNTFEASYDTRTYLLRGDVNHEFTYDNLMITPSANLTYAKSISDGYTESGGILAQTVSEIEQDSLVGGAGISFSTTQEFEAVTITPEFHVNTLYEFNDELGNYGISLANNTVNFADQAIEATDQFKVNVGASLNLLTVQNINLTMGYDGVFGENSTEHTGRLRAGVKF